MPVRGATYDTYSLADTTTRGTRPWPGPNTHTGDNSGGIVYTAHLHKLGTNALGFQTSLSGVKADNDAVQQYSDPSIGRFHQTRYG